PPLMSGLFHWGSGPLAPLPLAGAPFLAGALLVLAGLVLAWQLRPTGEERSWTG
ncbi:TPA: MFS transporter, partial [Pseudomonas aeruginosa]|nr:MFS transporter [Pseudomonas aeruginosa]HBO6342930.1 MFS transporter [Pseudomonas aeruginosa]HBO8277342.1 MFS transporter [Pseudomonas aeruginosa]